MSSTVEIHHHDSFSRNENLEEEQQKNTLWKRVLGVNRQMLTSKAWLWETHLWTHIAIVTFDI